MAQRVEAISHCISLPYCKMLPTPYSLNWYGTRSESDHVGVQTFKRAVNLSSSKVSWPAFEGYVWFLGVRETSALSLIIFLYKAEFGRRSREGEREGDM